LDLLMGCDKRVIYDFVNVVQGEASLQQALIKDNNIANLYILASSQIRDKDVLTKEGVAKVIADLKEAGFDYIVCDSPAGIEKGAQLALYFSDEAIVVVNPEVSSVRDADRMLGLLQAKSKRAEEGRIAVKEHLLLTRYNPQRVAAGEMLSVEKVINLLRIPLLGVVPESGKVLKSSNSGYPVILDKSSDASIAYQDIVARFVGEEREQRFINEEKKGFFINLIRNLIR
ncbi:MAG TPA: septum site-determining protein MinD, partial [Thiomicrospira sp.]|nr:septum site-determining protein MinD [Thiomicrospira sp.]